MKFTNPFRRKRVPKAHVVLRFSDGGTAMLGPMDEFVAEIFLAHRLAADPFYGGRRVAGSRIVRS